VTKRNIFGRKQTKTIAALQETSKEESAAWIREAHQKMGEFKRFLKLDFEKNTAALRVSVYWPEPGFCFIITFYLTTILQRAAAQWRAEGGGRERGDGSGHPRQGDIQKVKLQK